MAWQSERNEVKPALVALQAELMKEQHWAAVPPGEMPLGKDLLITTIWKRASAADAVMMLGRGRQDRARDRAEQPDQCCGREGTAHGDYATSIRGARGETPPGFGAQEWRCKVLGITLIQSEPTFCKVSGQDKITLLLTSFLG